jgi:cell division FtsZ-interacting protein ZapD
MEGELHKNFQKQSQELQRRKEDNSTDRESIRRLNDQLAAKEMDLQEANDLNAKNSESLNRVVSIYYNCFLLFTNLFKFICI